MHSSCTSQVHDTAQYTQPYRGVSKVCEAKCLSSEALQHNLLLSASRLHCCRTPEPYVKLECSQGHAHRHCCASEDNCVLTVHKPGA